MTILIKNCEYCGHEYVPDEYNAKTQKYCSKKCKERMAWKRQKESGNVRSKKGGYPRAIYIQLWMEARLSDNTAPCHYCKKRLKPERNSFVLDHKIPVSELSTREEVMNPENLCVCCSECNVEKSNKYSYEEFLAIKKETHGGD